MSRRSHPTTGFGIVIRLNAASNVSPVLALAASIAAKAQFMATWMPRLMRCHSAGVVIGHPPLRLTLLK
jgi:hypothetical protein